MISAIRCGEKIHAYIGIGYDYQPNELYIIGILDISKKSNIVHP